MARTRKQVVASKLNWDKMQLVSALIHLNHLLKEYSICPEEYQNELNTVEAGIRQGMVFKARDEKIRGDYTRNCDTVNFTRERMTEERKVK